ncbi:MAG: hypothetical protein QM811_21280 [Pirellulales bacterium]
MISRKHIAAFLCALSLGLGSAVSVIQAADAEILAQYYGSGVHEYNAGNFNAAYEDLTSAITGGTDDPRAYYFRGLVFLNMGREPEALADFQKGADLEANDTTGFFNVGKSLERVQGSKRLVLEKYRSKARVALFTKVNAAKQQRYEQARINEAEMRRAAPIPKTEVEAGPTQRAVAVPTAPAALPGGDADPFGGAGTPAEKPAAPAAENPFGAPATPAPAADPFAAPAPRRPPRLLRPIRSARLRRPPPHPLRPPTHLAHRPRPLRPRKCPLRQPRPRRLIPLVHLLLRLRLPPRLLQRQTRSALRLRRHPPRPRRHLRPIRRLRSRRARRPKCRPSRPPWNRPRLRLRLRPPIRLVRPPRLRFRPPPASIR